MSTPETNHMKPSFDFQPTCAQPTFVMKRFFSALLLCIAAGSTLVSGCSLLQAPAPDPIPLKPKEPKPGLFIPTDYNTKGIELNKAGDAAQPEYFEVTRIDSGELLWLRTVDINKAGTPPTDQTTYGAPDMARLAGISVPQPGQPGAQESMSTLRRWTFGRKLTVEQDGRYPVDLQNRRRVQIFFPGGKDGAQSLNLNRMMVRSGYAVVNVFEPTSFDVKGWLNDEEYARINRLGLWKLGIVINQRQPPPLKTTVTEKTTRVTTTTGSAPPLGAPAPKMP